MAELSSQMRSVPLEARQAPLRPKPSSYPAIFAPAIEGREKRPLGDLFGLKNFGVNLTSLAPNGRSALLHRHRKQDEFIYILEGTPTLITEEGEYLLAPGQCVGFPAAGQAHQLHNRAASLTVYLEIGDRSPGDEVDYPQDDLKAVFTSEGVWRYSRKNGQPL